MSYRLAHLLSAALVGACTAASAFAADTSLIWRGDITTARGVVIDVAKNWEKTGHGKIEMQPFNTASGLDAVLKGTADMAGSARGAGNNPAEGSLTFTPVAWDALVMITSPSNPVSSITLQQLHDIYFGKITNWKELGGRDEPIDLYAVASPGDGVEYSLRRLLFGRGNQPVAAPRLYVNTAKLEEAVTLDTKGLGATTMAGVHGNGKVKMLRINGTAPTPATVANGSYLLFTQLYLVTNPASPKAAQTKAFLDFLATSQAKSILRAHDVLPYDEGATLASLDGSRRSKILAEVGAKASSEPLTTPSAAPVLAAAAAPAAAAPLAAQASAKNARAAALAARKAKAAELAAAREATRSQFAGVTASAASTARPGFQGIQAEAVTVAALANRGALFARVTSEVFTAHGKLAASALKAPAAAPLAALREKAAATPVKLAAARPSAPAHAAKAAGKAPAAKAAVAARGHARTYKVGPGDTLYSIAKKHAVDVAQVRAWNRMKDNTVRPGQVLRVSAR
jgi:phosphate transport system substrate-binding protein